MKKENCFELGIITKAHSFKGEVILFLDTDVPENYYNLDHIFIEFNKQLIPYFIESSKVQKVKNLRLKLDGISTEQEALMLAKKNVYLPIEMLPELKADQFYFHEIVGYSITNQKNEEVATIIEVIDNNSGNRLLNVSVNSKEALLPFNDNHILKVDKPNKNIQLDIPEGLLELYL